METLTAIVGLVLTVFVTLVFVALAVVLTLLLIFVPFVLLFGE